MIVCRRCGGTEEDLPGLYMCHCPNEMLDMPNSQIAKYQVRKTIEDLALLAAQNLPVDNAEVHATIERLFIAMRTAPETIGLIDWKALNS
jgi:hypothetical protein